MVIGAQNALGGFLLAVIGGNEAAFLKNATRLAAAASPPSDGDLPAGARPTGSAQPQSAA
jgi:hypothetical protein